MARWAFVLVLLASCTHAPPEATTPPSPAPPPSPIVAPAKPVDEKLTTDEAFGPLVARLSEKAGDFPSENYVSNELSLLDVARELRAPALHGPRRAYVGVGPEQNYSYLAMLEPKVAYIVDIRRGNLLEHMFFRGCFEEAKTSADFLSLLTSKRADDGITRTKAVMDRLHVDHSKSDDAALARIVKAFAQHGLAIAYTMTGTQREYPTLGETLAAKDPDGVPASFVASEDRYARVRRLVVENRVIPVVGDFGATHALREVAADMKERGLVLGVFYTSNVEQYLFDGRKHGAFIESVRQMPRDDESRIVRVWFDQGRPHPEQHAKHRTTQIIGSANAFLARADAMPFKSYWEVVTKTSP